MKRWLYADFMTEYCRKKTSWPLKILYFRTTWLAVSASEALLGYLGWWKRTCQLHKCAGLQCVTNRTTESLMLWSDGHPFGDVKFPISRQWFLELCGSFDAIQIEYRICSCEKLGAITLKNHVFVDFYWRIWWFIGGFGVYCRSIVT